MIHYRVCTNGLLNSSYYLPSNTYAASSEVEELSSMIQDLDELMKAERSSHLADNGSDDVSVSSYICNSKPCINTKTNSEDFASACLKICYN